MPIKVATPRAPPRTGPARRIGGQTSRRMCAWASSTSLASRSCSSAAEPITIVGVEDPVIRAEHLVVMKIPAGRPRDLEDVERSSLSGGAARSARGRATPRDARVEPLAGRICCHAGTRSAPTDSEAAERDEKLHSCVLCLLRRISSYFGACWSRWIGSSSSKLASRATEAPRRESRFIAKCVMAITEFVVK